MRFGDQDESSGGCQRALGDGYLPSEPEPVIVAFVETRSDTRSRTVASGESRGRWVVESERVEEFVQTERRAGTRWKRGVECGKRHETSVGHSHWSRIEWNSDRARAPPRRVISPVALPWPHPPVCSFLGPPSPRASSRRSGDVSRAGRGQQWRDWAQAVGPRSGGGDLEGGRGAALAGK